MSYDAALQTLTARIEQARQSGGALAIRGGGSKSFYAHDPGIDALDTKALRGILCYEPSELFVTVAAGTSVHEVESLLHQHQQCLPFEPPHYAWSATSATGADGAATSVATIGGMVATGLAGPARANVGGVRDYVLGARLINGLGQHLTFGGQVMKNVAGYDVSRLMVGALGTLGVITEVTLKVLPVAPAQATLCFALSQAEALRHLHRWGGQPLPLSASCWVRDDTQASTAQGTGRDAAGAARKPDGAGPELLFVRLRGAQAAVEAACRAMLQELPGKRLDNAVATPDWERCRNHQLPFFTAVPDGMVLWRLSLPQTAPVLNLPWPTLVEWHGALRWLWAPPDAQAQLSAAAQAAGGTAAVFYAPGQHNAAGARLLGADTPRAALHARLKTSFDPQGIFNPTLSPRAA